MTRSTADGPRTISFWLIAAIALVLFVVGVILFVGGAEQGSTSLVDVPQRRPEPTGPTLPDGSDAPEGVAEVLQADGALTYGLTPPESWADVQGEPSTVVAPVTVEQVDDGAALEATVSCAASASEFLAQVGLTESGTSITVLAIAVQPPAGATPAAPCDPAAAPRVFRLPLQEPVGSRSVVVVPAGPVPG